MRLILVGSEYSGKSTLVKKIVEWRDRLMGQPTPLGIVQYHDHFTQRDQLRIQTRQSIDRA